MGYTEGNAWWLFGKHAAPLIAAGMSLLEMGPGKIRRSLVRRFAEERGCAYFFADIRNAYQDHPGFVRMSSQFQMESDSDRFDAAVSYQMLHNVRMPWRWLPEVVRVVRPGGLVVVNDNVTWDVNRYPVDCGRWFPDGLDALFEDAGLEVLVNAAENLDTREPLRRRHQIGNAPVVDLIAVGRKPS